MKSCVTRIRKVRNELFSLNLKGAELAEFKSPLIHLHISPAYFTSLYIFKSLTRCDLLCVFKAFIKLGHFLLAQRKNIPRIFVDIQMLSACGEIDLCDEIEDILEGHDR